MKTRAAKLAPEEWDFESITDPDELEACFWWEHIRSSRHSLQALSSEEHIAIESGLSDSIGVSATMFLFHWRDFFGGKPIANKPWQKLPDKEKSVWRSLMSENMNRALWITEGAIGVSSASIVAAKSRGAATVTLPLQGGSDRNCGPSRERVAYLMTIDWSTPVSGICAQFQKWASAQKKAKKGVAVATDAHGRRVQATHRAAALFRLGVWRRKMQCSELSPRAPWPMFDRLYPAQVVSRDDPGRRRQLMRDARECELLLVALFAR
jgi:hypothetical protein